MGSKMLIDATHAEETRVVVVRGNRIDEFDFESAARRQLKGNIYLAKVTRVEPSLQAAFVEYGGNRHGFLAFAEIHPDYYQIPMADRQALVREQEEEDARHRDDDDDDNHDQQEQNDNQTASREDDDRRGEALDAGDAEPAVSEEANGDNGEGERIAAPSVQHGLPAERDNGIEVVDDDPEHRKVDSVGAEDALEEVPQRQRRAPKRHYKIQEVIKRRQVILVQVVKEERGNKGAALTTYLSLAGRYCVLMPNTARGGGISRKITDAGDRRRLKEVARDIEIPQGMGLIVRTAGAQRTKTEIRRDYDYLIRMWESVRDLTLSSQAPALVYEEGSLIKRAIRDLYTKDVDEVHVEGEPAYREAKDFMKMLMPSHAKNVKLYKDTRPLFSRFQVESQLDSLYSPTVTLPSGGYMVMNQTEALVAIDINSGKATREHNIEDTALKTNLEASDEIARQLRLRDLAGLVVVDFIDMEENRNNRAVERRIKDALKNDRARIQVGRISHFGLLEMSRQRLRPGLLEGSSRTCPHCEGRGIVRSVSSCGLSVLRAIEEHLIARKAENLTVKCHHEVAVYILNEKRDNLLSIETSYGISIFIVSSDDLKGSQAVIERAGERNIPPRKVQTAPIRMDSAFAEDDEADVEETVAEEAVSQDQDDDGQSDEPSKEERTEGQRQTGERGDGQRRKRRRGRRGGRGGNDDIRPLQEMPAGIPGLGDQPSIAAASDDRDGQAATMGDEAGDAAPGNDNEQGQGRREDGGQRRGRRDRWGRNRERSRGGRERPAGGEDRSPGEEALETRVEPAVQERIETPAQRVEAEPPPRLAPVDTVLAEAPAPEPEARKWQPPAPTIAPVVSERKSGWWSKR